MSSTEFRCGLDGSRVSSKVLKPPGGGSSDIFGLGSAPSSNATKNSASNSQNRLFGTSDPPAAPIKPQPVAQAAAVPTPSKKRVVRRNPITGEEIEYYPEGQKSSVSEEEKPTNGVRENGVSENGEVGKAQNGEDKEEEKKEVKPVQTSIRVRNPPGGKSSGIF